MGLDDRRRYLNCLDPGRFFENPIVKGCLIEYGGGGVVERRQRLMGTVILVLLLIVAVCPCGVFAESEGNKAMETRCAASKEGTEADVQTKKICAGYFEQTGANVVNGVVTSAGYNVSSRERFREAAAVAVGASVLAGVLATGIIWDTFSALSP